MAPCGQTLVQDMQSQQSLGTLQYALLSSPRVIKSPGHVCSHSGSFSALQPSHFSSITLGGTEDQPPSRIFDLGAQAVARHYLFIRSGEYFDFSCFEVLPGINKAIKLRIDIGIIHPGLPSRPPGLPPEQEVVD